MLYFGSDFINFNGAVEYQKFQSFPKWEELRKKHNTVCGIKIENRVICFSSVTEWGNNNKSNFENDYMTHYVNQIDDYGIDDFNDQGWEQKEDVKRTNWEHRT